MWPLDGHDPYYMQSRKKMYARIVMAATLFSIVSSEMFPAAAHRGRVVQPFLSIHKSNFAIIPRGGEISTAVADFDEYEVESEDESETESEEESEAEAEDIFFTEDESEEEQAEDLTLTHSAMSAVSKSQKKHAQESKQTVNASLQKANNPKKKSQWKKMLRLPYIIRACLNPFTVFAMTRAYFASLFNISYLEEVCLFLFVVSHFFHFLLLF